MEKPIKQEIPKTRFSEYHAKNRPLSSMEQLGKQHRDKADSIRKEINKKLARQKWEYDNANDLFTYPAGSFGNTHHWEEGDERVYGDPYERPKMPDISKIKDMLSNARNEMLLSELAYASDYFDRDFYHDPKYRSGEKYVPNKYVNRNGEKEYKRWPDEELEGYIDMLNELNFQDDAKEPIEELKRRKALKEPQRR